MKSYVKIYGPPVLEAIKELDKIAVDMEEVCIMNPLIQLAPTDFGSADETRVYFDSFTRIDPTRCEKIISKSGESLGDYDYYFEWFQRPRMKDMEVLLKKIDAALKPVGCRYSITTK
ncbi:hypothetical protein JXL21_11170 [Candidatus Bathyarchaeota archaeon]|nr:hypothetical protein [Candidatus Bathyarchaeota archaeon]